MQLVTFHVTPRSGAGPHPNTTQKADDYVANIDLLFDSARRFHGDCRFTILTDHHTNLDALKSRAEIVRENLPLDQLMLARAEAQDRYVQRYNFARPLLLVDSDILINGSLTDILRADFDVGVTHREHAEMPYNGGLLILNRLRPQSSRSFFSRLTETYRTKYTDQASWYGDQLALRDCVPPIDPQLGIVTARDVRFLILPCDTYNFSPLNTPKAIATPLSEKKVLHFKGARKPLMPLFWRAWLQTRRSLNPLRYLDCRKARLELTHLVSRSKH